MKKFILFSTVCLMMAVTVNAQIKFYSVDKETNAKLVPASLYSVVPNDGRNDKPALKYLIRKVSAMQNTFIVLQPGKYDVKKLRIDYEILADEGRVQDATPTPKGYKKMFFIFLIKDNEQTSKNDLALK